MNFDRPIAIAVILFLAVIFVFFLVAPQYRDFKALQQELGEKTAEFNAKYDYFSAIAKTYSDLQARPDDLKKIDDALPENPNIGALIYFFQRKSLENGIILTNVLLNRSSAASQDAKVKEIIFSLSLTGNYSALENFIASLEKSDRLFQVASISFNYGNKAIGTSLYSFNLEVRTYSY